MKYLNACVCPIQLLPGGALCMSTSRLNGEQLIPFPPIDSVITDDIASDKNLRFAPDTPPTAKNSPANVILSASKCVGHSLEKPRSRTAPMLSHRRIFQRLGCSSMR